MIIGKVDKDKLIEEIGKLERRLQRETNYAIYEKEDFKKKKEEGNPFSTYATSWEDYETNFITALKEIKESGINIGVFGDIDIEDHKNWVKKVCNKTNILEYLPLWKKPRTKIVQEFIDYGFKAIIVAVKNKL